jgi:DNA-3-methyladenine glycosylase I
MPPQYFTTPSDAVAPSNSRSAGSRDSTKMRCPWAITPLGIQYHDREWGVPQHDDRALFEFLVLEGAQAGLSWSTILQKRDNYRCAFDNFNGRKVARYDARKVSKLLADRGIVRNQLKIAAAIQNAKAFLAAQKEFGSFDAYIWRFVGGRPTRNAWRALNLGQRSRNRKWQMANGKWQIGVLQAHKKSCSQFVRIDPQPRTRPKPQRGKEDRRNGHSSCLHGSCG